MVRRLNIKVSYTFPASYRMFQVRGIRVSVGRDARVPAATGGHVEAARSCGIAALDGLAVGVVGGGLDGDDSGVI